MPVDMGATPSSGISAIPYGNLKRHLGIEGGHNRVYDVVQQLAQPSDELLAAYQRADLIVLNGAGFAKWVAGASLPPSRVVDTAASAPGAITPMTGRS